VGGKNERVVLESGVISLDKRREDLHGISFGDRFDTFAKAAVHVVPVCRTAAAVVGCLSKQQTNIECYAFALLYSSSSSTLL